MADQGSYKLDPSGLGHILRELRVSPENQQIGMDYLMGNWNDGPMTRPPYNNSAYGGIYKPYQYGEFSRQGNPLFKLGMFRGQGGGGAGTWSDPNRISPLPGRQQKYSHLNIPGTSAFSWGNQATDVTGHAIVREVTKEAHRKKMEAELARLGPDEYRSRYGDIPSEWGQEGKQIEGGGLSDEMQNAWGSYSSNADMIRIRQAENPNDARRYQGPDRVMGTVVHEGMHRGMQILEEMKAHNTSAWGRGMTDKEIINAPPGPLQPYRDLGGPWQNNVLASIPIEKHKLLEAMTPEERAAAIGGGGVSYLEKRFTDKPWERTIGGERITLPMLVNMYKYKDKTTNESPVSAYGGEHALMAMMMQKSPGGFDSDQMRMHAIKEMNAKIRPFITTKYNEALGHGERDPSSTADYPVNVGPQWLESLEGAGNAIEDYLVKRHRWTPGGGESTVLDRHIYGQYEVPD